VEYKDERSEDLRLHLFGGSLDMEAFPVVIRERRRLGAFEADAAIIGASHAVQVRIGEETLTEVLACRVAAVDAFADRLRGVWRIEETVGIEPVPGIRYACACEATPLESSQGLLLEFRAAVESAAAAGGIGLGFRFPQRTDEAPETLLHVSAHEGEMSIRSLHVYPNEGAVVRSETRLTAAPSVREAGRQLLEVGSR